jgi:hypothetical protein
MCSSRPVPATWILELLEHERVPPDRERAAA